MTWHACKATPRYDECFDCSTLDPVLRMEQQGVTPQGLALILAIFAYLFAKPGMWVLAPHLSHRVLCHPSYIARGI